MRSMSRIKALALSVLTVAACAILSGSALIDEDRMTQQTFNYKTATVERSVFERDAAMSGMVYYTKSHEIRYRGKTANFVRYSVKQNKEVKAGDPIAAVTVKGSRVELQTMKMQLARQEKNYGDGLAEMREQLRKTQKKAAAEHCVSLRLDVVKGNIPAENLYRRCGYQYIDTVSLGYECYGLPWFDLYEKVL